MEKISKRWICVFCGSAMGARPEYESAARDLGRRIAESGYGLVYGGGSVGLMGVLADAALAAGGEVVGIIPDVIVDLEVGHSGLTELLVVRTMHERKALMAERADAFMALPGGYGTMDEFMEIVTWAQLGIHSKPCVLVNVAGYYDALMRFLDVGVSEGFIRAENRALVQVAKDIT
ncbi:MAG TPA: TIGR00730 family Rossman fold protein, partial [Acidobacteriaceae bacterium]|nr:TIGR00730 family Rossman fold protein [Acidobacteriaceae bacterium]